MDTLGFIHELSRLRPSSTFLTLKGYRNLHSEIADYNIVFHMSYQNALKKSIEILSSLQLGTDLEQEARLELIQSYSKSLGKMETTPMEELEDHYTHFFDADGKPIKGVKIHNETGTLHIYGLIQQKRVLMPGIYPKVNSKPLTIAKNKLASLTPCGKFRQFRILPSQVDSISVEKLSLLPPEV